MAYYKKNGSTADDIGMPLADVVVPALISFGLASIAFIIGKWGYSILWICIIGALILLNNLAWRKRMRAQEARRAIALREREVILAQLSDLPAWVQFPDSERVEWLNKVILQLWPYVGEYAKKFLNEIMLPQVRAQLPGPLKNFRFTRMDMGDIPCRVGGVKVYTQNVGRDRIIVDMEVAYAGDADFSVSCCGFQGGMNQVQFSGKLRAVLKPLLPYPPMVGGVSGSFLEMPKIDFNLTGMGEFAELPGLTSAVRSVLHSQVAALCVLPNEIVVPLAPDVDVARLFFPEPDGVIRLKIVEARKLENRDIGVFGGKSDPYCEIELGSQRTKTRTINNDLSPVWNETFELVVDQSDGQTLRLEVFDEDQGKDEELGRLALPLDLIRKDALIDRWFALEGARHGDIHIVAQWMELNPQKEKLAATEWEDRWATANRAVHSSLLMVFVDSISDLPYPKSKLEPSPYVELRVDKQSRKTAIKQRTVNPLYQQRFSFFVGEPEVQQLEVEAFDESTGRSLGQFTLALANLINEPDMQLYQQTFYITLGVHKSPLVMTVRLRALVAAAAPAAAASTDASLSWSDAPVGVDEHTLAMYGTDQHIERSALAAPNGGNRSTSTDRSSSAASSPLTSSHASNSRQMDRISRLVTHKHSRSPSVASGTAPQSHGELQIELRHSAQTQTLVVRCLRAKGLKPVDSEGSADPYVVVNLVSLPSTVREKRKTAIVKRALSPVFDNHFEFPISSSDLANHSVQFVVKDATNYGVFAKKPILGQLSLRLDRPDIAQRWVALEAHSK